MTGITLLNRYRPVFLIGLLFLPWWGCGQKTTPVNTNLISNSSFEKSKNGLPTGWTLENFRGLKEDKEVLYGIDSDVAYDGEMSFFFKGDPDTRRWYVLSQEIEILDVSHIQFKGAIRIQGAKRGTSQFAQCNYLFTFYDHNHQRFQSARFGDQRTRVKIGTTGWLVEDVKFRVPSGAAYVKVQCIMGMTGTVWFDDLSLTIPETYDWNKAETKNFTFHWMDERPFPAGAMSAEQKLFDRYCGQLGLTSDERIDYYLYPDSTTIRKMLNLKGVFYVSWDDKEVHTILPYEDHEIIHIITDPYGIPPKSICEGTVFHLQGHCLGQPFHPIARQLLAQKLLPTLAELTTYSNYAQLPSLRALPASGSFVAFICDTWGMDNLIELYRAAGGQNSHQEFSASFEQVYKVPLDEAEIGWRQFLVRGSFLRQDTVPSGAQADSSAVDGAD
jgi:hypothetical protein